MKVPESYEECDSTHLDLKNSCNLQGSLEIVSSDISVLWASALLTNWHLSDNDLLHIARSMSRSEYSRASVKVTYLKPFCVCRIYSNGRVLIMGTLTEKQAYKRLAKTVRKIKYRTKWKVQIPPSSSYYIDADESAEEGIMVSSLHEAISKEDTDNRLNKRDVEKTKNNKNKRRRVGLDGNGLTWKYVDNPKIYKVSESLKTFKIDQLYCKIVLNHELDLEDIYRKLNPKYINVNLFKNYLRFQFNLSTQSEQSDGGGGQKASNAPFSSEVYNNTIFFKEDFDISMELERVLENELASTNKTSSCLVFKSGKISILGCSNRAQIIYTFEQLIQYL